MTDRIDTSDPFRRDASHGKACPKRAWVLGVLADDEAGAPYAGELDDARNGRLTADLPLGLAVHLRQCASCRAAADDLMRVSAQLSALSAMGVSDALLEQGNARVTKALQQFPRVFGQGRKAASDDSTIGWVGGRLRRFGWLPALAASLLIVVGAASWFAKTRERAALRPTVAGEPVWPFDDDDVFSDVEQSEPGEGVRASADGVSQIAEAAATHDAGGKKASSGRRVRRRPQVVYYHSHIDAAMTDTPGAVQAAVVVPRRHRATHRTKWREVFDRSGGFLFTTPNRDRDKNKD